MQPPPNQQYYTQYTAAPQTQYVVTQPQMPYVQVGNTIQQPGIVMGGFPSTSAQLALILSIVSIFAGGICLAIPSLIVAQGALKVTAMYPGHPDASTAKTAQTISWVVIGLYLLILVFYMFLMLQFTSQGY